MEKATVVQRATLVATLAIIIALESEKSLPKQPENYVFPRRNKPPKVRAS